MREYNNMKKIREIYGATQDEIANIAGVSRSTVSQWESGSMKASEIKLEKLASFYGIGPESFYEIPDIDDKRRNILIASAKKAPLTQTITEMGRARSSELRNNVLKKRFWGVLRDFTMSMTTLFSVADRAELSDLKVALDTIQKMSRRLQALIEIREEEEKAKKEKNEMTLFDILESYYE